jgi:hypothetical protein
MRINSRIIYSTIVYLLIMVIITISKPAMIYDENENLRQFGLGSKNTMFSLGVVTCLTAVLTFFFFCVVDLVFV